MSPLKQACGCLNLHIGTELIGWFGVISAIIHAANTQTQHYPGITSPDHENAIPEVIACIVQIIIYGCLIRGSKTKNKWLLVPWLILSLIGLVIINFALIYEVTLVSNDLKQTILVALLIADIITGYMWLIVFSLYRQLDQNLGTIAIGYNEFYNTPLIPPSKV